MNRQQRIDQAVRNVTDARQRRTLDVLCQYGVFKFKSIRREYARLTAGQRVKENRAKMRAQAYANIERLCAMTAVDGNTDCEPLLYRQNNPGSGATPSPQAQDAAARWKHAIRP